MSQEWYSVGDNSPRNKKKEEKKNSDDCDPQEITEDSKSRRVMKKMDSREFLEGRDTGSIGIAEIDNKIIIVQTRNLMSLGLQP